MNDTNALESSGPLRAPSWLDKLNSSLLMLITPERAVVKRARGPEYGKRPTFERLAPMPLQHRTISGVKVRFAHAGSPDNPAVILFNPLPQTIVAFAPIWEHLASRFNLYAYDLPGFGGSGGADEWMTCEAQGRFLSDFIAEFGIQRPHLVAPDIGMPGALYYVENLPNSVESLIVGDGPGIAPSKNGSIIDRLATSGFWRTMFRITGAGTFVHGGNQLCYLNYSPNAEETSDYIRSYSGRIGPVTLWFKNYPAILATVDSKLAEIDRPVLIFWGNEDQLLLVDNAHRLAQRLKRSRLHIFEHCGHYSYQDKHEEFRDLVTEWVSGGYRSV